MNSDIKTVNEKIKFIEQHQDLYRQYLNKQIAIMDYEDAIEHAEEKGEEKGIEKGIKKIALKMKHEKISVDIINKITGLSKDTIQNL
ncbi:MAG: hypothetical protein LBM96_01280 [Methanobrevibacter sp.]|nr:hypothetical protein [Candidatus Methanoflexus mossambicus]